MSNIVLCPVDLAHDDSWQIALPAAVSEAKMRSAALHLMTIIPDFGSVLVAEAFPAGFAETTAAKSLERLKALKAEYVPAEIATETHVTHGHPAEQILEFADKLGATLIVLASHQPDILRSFFVGSVADKVVHHAKQSVLVVRAS